MSEHIFKKHPEREQLTRHIALTFHELAQRTNNEHVQRGQIFQANSLDFPIGQGVGILVYRIDLSDPRPGSPFYCKTIVFPEDQIPEDPKTTDGYLSERFFDVVRSPQEPNTTIFESHMQTAPQAQGQGLAWALGEIEEIVVRDIVKKCPELTGQKIYLESFGDSEGREMLGNIKPDRQGFTLVQDTHLGYIDIGGGRRRKIIQN